MIKGRTLVGTTLMAAGWWNTVVASKGILGLVCLIGSFMMLREEK